MWTLKLLILKMNESSIKIFLNCILAGGVREVIREQVYFDKFNKKFLNLIRFESVTNQLPNGHQTQWKPRYIVQGLDFGSSYISSYASYLTKYLCYRYAQSKPNQGVNHFGACFGLQILYHSLHWIYAMNI